MTDAGCHRRAIGAIGATRLALNEAVFEWCLRNVRRSLARNLLEPALRWGLLGAESAVSHRFGWLASPALEDALLAVASRLPEPDPGPAAERPHLRWLHVMDRTYAIGGHTALVYRWMQRESRGDRHSVLLLSHQEALDPRLLAAARDTGGTVRALAPDAPLLERAVRLREEARKHADRVVLHVHPWSVVPVVALGVPGGPPVMLINHLSHEFWVGGSVADLVLNLRSSALEWSEAYRGIARNAMLPIPVFPRAVDRGGSASPETRRAARQALGVPSGALVLLTVGSAYKYRPLPGLDFLDAAAAILRACPQAYLVAVGPHEDARWKAVRERSGRRLLAAGPQLDLTHFHQAADVYLEGFPIGSPTALLEAGLSGIPCVRAPRQVPPPLAMDGIGLGGSSQPASVADYVDTAITLVRNEDERRAQGLSLERAIRAHHTEPYWSDYLRRAESALPGRHGVYPLAGAAPLPASVRELTVALSTLGNAEDALTVAIRAAFELGLGARVDLPLARALVTRCLRGDPRVLGRKWLLVALAESVAGHGPVERLRRAKRRLVLGE